MPPRPTQISENDLRQLGEIQLEVQSKLFDKAATYNNIVVSLGYAGFFGIWIWSRELIHPWDAKLTALLLGLSLFMFVLWNVVTNYVISVKNIKLSQLMTSTQPSVEILIQKLVHLQRQIHKEQLAYYAAWYIIFLATSILGFLSGALLIILIGLDVLGLKVGVHSLFGVE